MRLRITTAPALSTPCIWKTDFAISRPIVLTSPMDGSPQCGLLKATTLWHFDAAEWAPSTASKADICFSLDDLIRAGKKCRRNSQAQPLCGFKIDGQLEFSRLHDREIGWFLALENPASVDTSLSECVRNISTVTNESTLFHKFMSYVTRRHLLSRHHRNNLGAMIVEEWIGSDHEGVNTLLVKGSRNGGEVTL